MANKPFVYSNMKKCSPALIIREVQIQTTMRYQLKLMSMATIHIHAHRHTHTHTHTYASETAQVQYQIATVKQATQTFWFPSAYKLCL